MATAVLMCHLALLIFIHSCCGGLYIPRLGKSAKTFKGIREPKWV